MEKIFQAYCQRRGVDLKSVRFMFDGQNVQPDVTPKMLELQNNDQIYAMIMAVGC
jgi:small ubiquitin-related modifier